MATKINDYDIWFQPCNNCGYDTGKATAKSERRCWRCGQQISRDYSDRALKTHNQPLDTGRQKAAPVELNSLCSIVKEGI